MSAAPREEPSAAAEVPLLRTTAKVAALVERLRKELAELEARDAVARAGLAAAAVSALARAAEARAELRRKFEQGQDASGPVGGATLRRALWAARRGLATLGHPGQAMLVAGSGMWRSGGLREVLAYVGRGADPAAVPSSLFDQAWYLARNPDVAASGAAPLLHYLVVGQLEGRDPHPLFDTSFYAGRHGAALAASRAWPLAHFIQAGGGAGLSPHPLIDPFHYMAQGASPAPGEDIVTHYLREGWRQDLSPHPLFDPAWYRAQTPVAAAETPPLLHYVREGAAAGLSPHPLFDPAWYCARAPEAGPNPLRHYLLQGAERDLSPSRWFDPQHYRTQRGDRLAPEANPLIDYLEQGAWVVAEPAPAFATLAYVAAHPQSVTQGLTPLAHWARSATERRQPD